LLTTATIQRSVPDQGFVGNGDHTLPLVTATPPEEVGAGPGAGC
jgi:hypothetical protein